MRDAVGADYRVIDTAQPHSRNTPSHEAGTHVREELGTRRPFGIDRAGRARHLTQDTSP